MDLDLDYNVKNTKTVTSLEERISDIEKFLHYEQAARLPDAMMTYASGIQMPQSQIHEMRTNLGIMMAEILTKWQKRHFTGGPVDPTKK